MKRTLQGAVSLVVTVFFLWWTFRGTDFAQQWSSLRAAHWAWLPVYAGTCLLVHLCRTLRWGCLLSGLERVPFRKLNEASAIGFMMLIVLPFRLGEFARPYLIAQRSSIRKSAAMTSVVLERIVDGIAIAVLLRVLLFFVPPTAPNLALVKLASNAMFAIFAGGLAFLLFALWQQARAVAVVRWTAGRLSPRLADRIAGIVDTFVGALRALPSAGQTFAFLLYTVGYWGVNGLGMAIIARAFGCTAEQAACLPFALTVFQAFVVMGVLVVGVMIPSAPGMVGTFQAAIRIGLELFLPAAIVVGKGLAYANVVWVTQTAIQIGLGLIFMAFGHMSFRDIAGKITDEKDRDDKDPPDDKALLAPQARAASGS